VEAYLVSEVEVPNIIHACALTHVRTHAFMHKHGILECAKVT